MVDKQELAELKLELEKANRRLDQMERRVQDQAYSKHDRSSGSIWVLIPVAAIVMWGLTQIF